MEPPASWRRLGEIRTGLLQDLVGLPELANLALEFLHPNARVGRHARAHAGVDPGHPDPTPQRLGRAADLARHRHQCRPLRSMTARALTNQTHRPLANLVGKLPALSLLFHDDPFLTRRSLRETQVGSLAYLADLLTRIRGHDPAKLDDLLPWNWAASVQATAKAA
jgi:hypothetical protein